MRDPRTEFVHKFPEKCCASVTRKGEDQPCDKVAVAVRVSEGRWWPVCAYHTRGAVVPLAEVMNEASQW